MKPYAMTLRLIKHISDPENNIPSLNKLLDDPTGTTPSEQEFVWTKGKYKKFTSYLEKLKVKINYSESGDESQSEEDILWGRKDVLEKVKHLSLEERTDLVYHDLVYSADRWDSYRMARVVAQVEALEGMIK